MECNEPSQCLICHGVAMRELSQYATLTRVTSDSRPLPPGGKLCYCPTCGLVQKPRDSLWFEECQYIYDNYQLYHQSLGAEQIIFNHDVVAPRSSILIDNIRQHISLLKTGQLLDVGCGNGAMLKAFHQQYPNWKLFGFEIDRRYDEELRKIQGFCNLYCGNATEISNQFNLITMVHALEHIAHPDKLLAALASRLVPEAYIFAQVPFAEHNPFDLLIADHVAHYSPTTLRKLFENTGFDVTRVSTEWVIKELSIIGKSQAETVQQRSTLIPSLPTTLPTAVTNTIEKQLAWLLRFEADACTLIPDGQLGIFGTSIAGTWLFGVLSERVDFFVDEDPSRANRKHFDRPVYSPKDIPPGSDIIIALVPTIAQSVKQRLASITATFHCPPDFAA